MKNPAKYEYMRQTTTPNNKMRLINGEKAVQIPYLYIKTFTTHERMNYLSTQGDENIITGKIPDYTEEYLKRQNGSVVTARGGVKRITDCSRFEVFTPQPSRSKRIPLKVVQDDTAGVRRDSLQNNTITFENEQINSGCANSNVLSPIK